MPSRRPRHEPDPTVDLRLAEADLMRETDPDEALERYATGDPARVAASVARLEWICERVRPCPPDRYAAILEHGAAGPAGRPRRVCLQLLGTLHWYRGRISEARRFWLQAIEEGREHRDDLWIKACLNLGLVYSTRGSFFESYVLTQMSCRAAEAAGYPYQLGFGTARVGHLLVSLGDFERAMDTLGDAERIARDIDDPRERQVVESSIHKGWGHLHRDREDWAAAVEVYAQEIETIEDVAAAKQSIVGGAHMLYWVSRMELEPDRFDEYLTELRALEDRFEFTHEWSRTYHWYVNWYTLQHELRRDASSERVRELCWELLENIRATPENLRSSKPAVNVGRIYAKIGETNRARECFDLAATATMRTIVEADRAARELPELAEATPADWAILAAFRDRLLDQQSELLDVVAAHWKPGENAFDLIVQDNRIHACAWCRRVRVGDANWLPIAGYVPASSEVSVTHCMCPDCADREMDH
ncbi:MAG: hypothetical protein KDC38_03825 [Planctomycetes bacterium]|nr:hypothetical protein [Planctomycetota bacterium]